MVPWMYSYDNTHQIIHLKYEQFIGHQLYHNKAKK